MVFNILSTLLWKCNNKKNLKKITVPYANTANKRVRQTSYEQEFILVPYCTYQPLYLSIMWLIKWTEDVMFMTMYQRPFDPCLPFIFISMWFWKRRMIKQIQPGLRIRITLMRI